jgi:hypothetical protein
LVFYKILEKYMDLKNPHLGLYAWKDPIGLP